MRPLRLALSIAALTHLACGAAGPGAATAGRAAEGPDTLVVFDGDGDYAWLGELYAQGMASVASHFAGTSIRAVRGYRAGDILAHRAIIYVGSSSGTPLPPAFLDDVLAGARPVVWVGGNIAQLSARASDFVPRYGFAPAEVDTSRITEVRYKNEALSRAAENTAGITTYSVLDARKATVLASAIRGDGVAIPWALRARSLTYVGENPLAYITPNDRYLAFCDLLFDALGADAPERHRALVRIEDVHPETPPEKIRAIAEALAEDGVPFGIAVIPVYVPKASSAPPAPPVPPVPVRLADRPELVESLRFAVAHGGTLVLHGYTHQYRALANPYDGGTGEDFEFFRAHLEGGATVLDGPVEEDSPRWAIARVDAALGVFDEARLPRPSIFEFPHYAASSIDARAIANRFSIVYQRELYFAGGADARHSLGLFFPFAVNDVYGWTVIPENLGHYVPPDHPDAAPHVAADLALTARLNRVVRDGVASFFFHPQYDVATLRAIVLAIRREGYTFVSAESLARERR